MSFSAVRPVRRLAASAAVAAVAAQLFLPVTASAGPTIWTPPVYVSGDADVLNLGAGSYAYALSNASPTVNGVTFTGANSTSALGGNVTFTPAFNGGNNATAFGSGAGSPYADLSAAYKDVLRGGSYGASTGAVSVSLGGLTADRDYAAQYWVSDNRSGATATRTGTATGTGGGNTVTLDYNSTNAAGGVGQSALGLFRATGATQSFSVQGNASTQINALQVREVTNIGRWTGTNGGTWDAAATANFASNFRTDPLAVTTFDVAKAPLNAVTFADAYFDAGAAVPVTQTTVTIDAGGVTAGVVRFDHSAVSYTVTGGSVTGTGTALAKDGTGTLTLAAANTYTGGTYVNGGTVVASVAGSLGTGTVVNNGTLELKATTTGTLTYTGMSTSMTGTGTLNVYAAGTGTNTTVLSGNYSGFAGTMDLGIGAAAGAGKVAFTGTAAGTAAAAAINVRANSTLYVPAGVTHNAAITLNGGNTGESLGQLRLESNAVWAGPVTLAGPYDAADGAVGANSGSGTISGPIGESGGARALRKLGNGTTILSGANTYTGGTTVSAGTLLVNTPAGAGGTDSGTGTGPVSVAAGTLGGNGQIRPGGTNAVALATATVLSPGNNAIGTLTINSAGTTAGSVLTFAGTSSLAMQLNAGLLSDRVAVTGASANDVTFANTVVNFTDLSAGNLSAGDYTLFSADAPNAYAGLTLSGNTITGGLTIGTGLSAYPGATLQRSGNDIVLNVVPEPGTAGAVLLAGAAGLLSRRRRRHRSS